VATGVAVMMVAPMALGGVRRISGPVRAWAAGARRDECAWAGMVEAVGEAGPATVSAHGAIGVKVLACVHGMYAECVCAGLYWASVYRGVHILLGEGRRGESLSKYYSIMGRMLSEDIYLHIFFHIERYISRVSLTWTYTR
jgi:hypothetical protein